MKRFRSIIRKFRLLIPLGVLLWLVFGIYRPFEPHYQGRPLSYWAKGVSSPYANPNYHNSANDLRVDAIRHIGTNALPYAIKFCSTREFEWRLKVYDWIDSRYARRDLFGEMGFNGYRKLDSLIHTAEDTRSEGISIFAALGPMAKPAIPDLIKLLGDNNGGVGMAAYNGQMNIGPDAIPQLIVAMTNQDETVRHGAMFCLGRMIDTTGNLQTEIRPAIPLLIAQLNHGSTYEHQLAAKTLGKIRQDAPVVVPALIDALKRESNFNRSIFDQQSSECFEDSWAYMETIASFHTNAQPAVPYLIETIKSDPSPLARAALVTLRQVAPEVAEPYIQKFNAAFTNRMPDDLISNVFYNFYGQGEPPSPVDRREFQ